MCAISCCLSASFPLEIVPLDCARFLSVLVAFFCLLQGEKRNPVLGSQSTTLNTSWSKEISLPRPILYDLHTRIPFSSNWTLWSLLKPSILFTSKVIFASSTSQTHADVPFTGLSESALLMSPADRMSCPSLQKRRVHVFIEHRILWHTSLPYCGSESRTDKLLNQPAYQFLLLLQWRSYYDNSQLHLTADKPRWCEAIRS